MLMLASWGESLIRTIIFGLDKTIYKFIPTLYDFVQILAKQQLLDQPTLQGFANNIYTLLAVFMLFRLAFVLLGAIIDPDKLTNKDKGFSKIMTRFITGMFLIVLIPWAFDYAFKLQDLIISGNGKGNLMTKVIFGSSSGSSSSAGYTLAKTALQSFYYCADLRGTESTNDETGKTIVTYECGLLSDGYNKAFSGVASDAAPDDEAAIAAAASTRKEGWKILSSNLNETKDDDYLYNYSAFISTACGIVILLMLVTLSIDVGVRVVKLSFLQLITPVAVAGYIEPGGKRFQEWLKIVTTTYLNLFIRLLAISVVAYIISLLDPNNFTPVDINGNAIHDFILSSFVRIFIIIGCLLFAKEAPKMLTDILGVKEAGLGGLNPLKKLGAVPIIGGAAAAGIGMGIGATTGLAGKGIAALGGGLSGGISSKFRHGGFGAGFKQGASSAASGVSMKGGIKGVSKQFGGVMGAWHKGAVGGATGAKGKDTKVGFGAIGEHRKNVASDQQTVKRQEYDASMLANTQASIENIRRSHGSADLSDSTYDYELFDNEEFGNKFRDFTADSKAAKGAEADFQRQQEMYNRELEDKTSRVYTASDFLAQAREEKSKWTEGTAGYNTAERAEQYWQSELKDASKHYLASKDALKKANDKLEASKTAFENEKKLSRNAKDVEKLNYRSELKNRGNIK